MSKSTPLFIVGAPRSGTTMLAAMVGSHPAFAIGPETQFFSKLTQRDFDLAAADPDWPAVATTKIAGLTLAGQSVMALFGTSRAGVSAYLTDREPSAAAMLESLCVPFAEARAKPRWAEKTPNHLLSLPQIRTHWPEAKIVRIVRDPRDSALSTCKLPTFSDDFAANLYLWRRWQDKAAEFLAEDNDCYSLKYESLVLRPEEQLRHLCEFLDVEYTPAMVEFGKHAADVSSAAETWKKPVSGTLDPSRLFALKRVLGEEDRFLANNVTYEYLQEFDYERETPVAKTRTGYRLSPEFVDENGPLLHKYLIAGTRWLPEDDLSKADYVLEHPPYWQFRNPVKLARLAIDKLHFRLGRIARIPGLWRTKMALREMRKRRLYRKALKAVDNFPTVTAKKPHGLPAPLVITLTSYPPRFPHLGKTLRSLLDQTVRADRTILWIAHEDFDLLPEDVLAVREHGLEIVECDNLLSYKKLIPALEEDPDRYFVTADDDVYYPPDWLAGLVDTAHDAPDSVVAWRAHEAPVRPDGRFSAYAGWMLATHRTEVSRPDLRLFPTGVGGVLYPPNCFAPEVCDHKRFMELAPRGDDIWFFWMARKNGISQRRVDDWFDIVDWPSTQEVALYATNLDGDGNDVQIRAVEDQIGMAR